MSSVDTKQQKNVISINEWIPFTMKADKTNQKEQKTEFFSDYNYDPGFLFSFLIYQARELGKLLFLCFIYTFENIS